MEIYEEEIKKLKAEVAKAQAQRDLADVARRDRVAEVRELGQQVHDLQATLAEVTDSRVANDALRVENARLVKQAKANAAAVQKADEIVAAYESFADADKAIKALLSTAASWPRPALAA